MGGFHPPTIMTVLDSQTFAGSTLADSEGRTAALRTLESCLAGPDTPLDLILQDLCSVPNLFEFIVSALPSAEKLVHRILDTYPTDPALVEASSTSILLRRLSSTLFALPPDLFSSDISHSIGRYKVYVENALPVLILLCTTDFLTCITTDATPTNTLEEPEYDDEEFSGFFVRNKKQKKSKHRFKNDTLTIDVAPFHKLRAKVPLNNVEASHMARDIRDDLKKILRFHLELLLEPSLAQHLMDAYVLTGDGKDVHLPAPQETRVTEAVEPKQLACPKVQPMKVALYFKNADCFGEWRIIIGTDAIKKLRELATWDRKKCVIVVKKIKQLSKGHFSDENQIRLNGTSGVPIFEAKMRCDLRLVYQVDVVPGHDEEVLRQVIKIYSIHTHTPSNRVWDAMGQHLAGKGNEYRRRCIFRNRPANPGSDVYLPACFPPEEPRSNTKRIPLALSDDDMGKLHSFLVLDKYVTFSQALLHSLIANQDVRHVFELTQSERRVVECRTSCYVLGRSGTGKTTTMLFKMLGIQRAWQMQTSGMPKPRQIFVTKSRVLAAKVEEYFVKLLESLALAGYSLEDLKRMQTRNTEFGLVDLDDQERADIPPRYSELEENHFPLFVTFDQLAKMIATDVLSGDDPEARHLAKYFMNADEVQAQDSLVTYDVFARTYWPHFPQPLTKGLEPWLVFSEFIGIIKGSEKSLLCPGGFLDEEAYCNLPTRSNHTFANQRLRVYAIFGAYCKLKKERRHHDVADRTRAILKTLLGGTPLKGEKVDFLYIDEAQDNLLIDALLLRLICRNPEGLFWAGDTAQTISAGCSFRFDDLKAFLYRIEQDRSTYLVQDLSVTNPTAFQLTINYRSHGGIVSCAHTVIERITHFWPDAIDILQQEHGIVDGLKPKFFHGWDRDAIQYEQFLFGESGNRVEFGARQCILVRDDDAVERLRKEVGDIGLIMSLYDSKGLEFDDVLLYNFFEDSTVDTKHWDVLLNDMDGKVNGQDLVKVHAPSFSRNEGRYAGVCSELKLLYVGITRARKNLWIFDKSDKSEPMRMIWTSRDQIQNFTPRMGVPRLAVASISSEWEASGHELFRHKKYPQAMQCFSRASLPRMAAICEAFRLREVARAKVGVAPLKAQRDAFLTAADAFMTSAQDAPPGNNKLQYYRNAAECFVRAGNDPKAAHAYLDAEEYDLAARRYRKVGLFEKTLEVLHNHSGTMKSSDELLTVCRLFYCSKRDVERPRLPLFSTFKEELEFLENYDLDFARATLLENHGRCLEAAELHLSENRPFEAIEDLLKERGSRGAIQRAANIILDGLWRWSSFGIPSSKVAAKDDVVKLLKLAGELPTGLLDPLDRHELSMFHAIARSDLACLGKLSHEFTEKRDAAALLALDHFYTHLPNLKSYKLQDASLFLEEFRKYTRLLYRIISHPDPLSVKPLRRLFCITEISSTEYSMGPESFLYCLATEDPDGRMYHQLATVTLPKRELVALLRKYLAAHLRERVTRENELCYEAVVFSPCLTHIVTEQCNRDDCPLDHIKLADLDVKYYNTRIGIHLQQMCILQCMYSASHFPRRITVVRWLVSLYEALNPEFHVQGSTAIIDLSMIPNASEGEGVLRRWLWEAFRLLSLHHNVKGFFTTLLKLTSLLFVFDKSNALGCINQAHFVTHDIRPRELVYSIVRDGVEDLLSFFDGTMQTSISAGMKFLRYILKTELTTNLSVFCDYLEEVIAEVLISCRLSRDPPLDGLVLPRGWLSSNKDFSKKKEISIPLLLDLLDCVRDLLLSLQSGSASERYILSHSKLTQVLSCVFISRICRALCLLAYNIPSMRVKLRVRDILNALQTARAMQKNHFLYRKYASAERNDYLKVILDYDAGVVIQDLVQLLHERRGGQPMRLARLTHIYYENPLDIPPLVAPQLVKARSNLRVDAPTLTPRGVRTAHAEVAKETVEEILPEVHEAELVNGVEEEPRDLAPVTNEPALIRAHEFTEAETAAVATIQAAYRTYYKRREAQARAIGRGLTAQRNAIFITCLRNAYAFNWKKTPYRTLYLWALPRLIVCLDKALSIAYELKKKTKGLLLKTHHERLEELGERTNLINTLLKDVRELRKEIEPDATIHQKRDKKVMKKAVSDVKDIIYRLPTPTLAPEIREDFRIAHDLVMVEERPVSKPERPTLNTEDLDL